MKTRALTLVVLALTCSNVRSEPEPLGRLFFTPEQRALLERQRQRNPTTGAVVDDGSPITLNGRVMRSSGRNTAWVNGIALEEKDARSLTARPLRPGETVFGPGRDDQTDLLNGGTIQIHRRGR